MEYGTDDKVSEHDSLPGFNDPEWGWIPSIAPSGMDFYPMNSDEKVMFTDLQGSLLVGSLKFRRLYSISINKDKIKDTDRLSISNLICDKYILAQRGKKNYFLIVIKH